MKKLMSICALFCALAIGFTACDQEKPDDGNGPDNGVTETPEIKVTTSNGQIVVDASAVECSFNYEITNPVEGGKVTLEIPSNDWITNHVIDENTKTVTLTLTKNEKKETRQEMVTLVYTYGSEKVSTVASILQAEAPYDYVSKLTYGVANYYGVGYANDPELHLYYTVLATRDVADAGPNMAAYVLDFFSLTKTEDRRPLPGTYTMSATAGDFSITPDYAMAEIIGETESDYVQLGFEEGTVEVAKDGNVYTITGVLTDTEGKVHFIEFEGELGLNDYTILSTLTGDIEATMNGADGYSVLAVDYGDYYGISMTNWVIQITPVDMVQNVPFIFLDLCTPISVNISTGLNQLLSFDSLNNVDYTTGEDSFYMPGQTGYQLSWYLTCYSYDPDSGQIQLMDPNAPFIDGIMTFEPNADGTINLSADIYDDLGYNFKVTGTNLPVNYVDGQAYAASVSGMSAPRVGYDLVKPTLNKSVLR